MCIRLTWNLTGSCGQQQTSWVVSYGGKTIPIWRTAAILKIIISPYLSEKSSNFDEILYTAADFELDERHLIKNEEVALDRLPSSTERISCYRTLLYLSVLLVCDTVPVNKRTSSISVVFITRKLHLPPVLAWEMSSQYDGQIIIVSVIKITIGGWILQIAAKHNNYEMPCSMAAYWRRD